MVAYIQVNIGSGNGLLPDGTQPLVPEPMLTCHQWVPMMPKISFEGSVKISICKKSLKNILVELQAHLSGAYELK